MFNSLELYTVTVYDYKTCCLALCQLMYVCHKCWHYSKLLRTQQCIFLALFTGAPLIQLPFKGSMKCGCMSATQLNFAQYGEEWWSSNSLVLQFLGIPEIPFLSLLCEKDVNTGYTCLINCAIWTMTLNYDLVTKIPRGVVFKRDIYS